MKQTAVELFKQRLIQRGIGFNIKDFEEAKEMEKQQIIDAFNNGYYQETIGYNASEEYYNKTFKNK